MVYVPPRLSETAFTCPHCGAFSHQDWSLLTSFVNGALNANQAYERACCSHCAEWSKWHNDLMIYPIVASAPHPNPEMPDTVIQDYQEARSIASLSSRGAAALLRLALQKLLIELGGKGDNLNDDIATLVANGLDEPIQQALDVVRVVGNHTLHPGAIDLDNDPDLVISLFTITNEIVEDMISRPKRRAELFANLPQRDLASIEKRNREAKARGTKKQSHE